MGETRPRAPRIYLLLSAYRLTVTLAPAWAGVGVGVVVVRRCLMAFIGSVVLSACVSPQQQLATASAIKATDDQFMPFRQYESGTIREMPGGIPGLSTEKQLLAQVNRTTGGTAVALHIKITYITSSHHTYNDARAANAQPLPMRKISSKRSDCSKAWGNCLYRQEHVVDLPAEALRHAGAEGFPVKLFSPTGPAILVEIPKSLISAVFAAMENGEKTIASAKPKQ